MDGESKERKGGEEENRWQRGKIIHRFGSKHS